MGFVLVVPIANEHSTKIAWEVQFVLSALIHLVQLTFPQRLKHRAISGIFGTTKVVPFQNREGNH
jgi:hypothetical protein